MMNWQCSCDACRNSDICKYKATLHQTYTYMQNVLANDGEFLKYFDDRTFISSIVNTIGCNYYERDDIL